ncbi:MAG: ABC transporter permease [Hydrogenophaga sp.]|uniref:MlaE family ABC transporter permease n=1 Tax=Hydrogenophaga sp. TaxID=1904254 RepID=UPI0027231950|nr:ABC transporter permease [Hydrogenophaga sp.]MDO9506458.1 ABC transporter permease [Hydrogenophaga sp.]MDP3625603.1 ABC transporter permease [Hydrogenophaga sp.]
MTEPLPATSPHTGAPEGTRHAASAQWTGQDNAWVLGMGGEWRGHRAALPAAPGALVQGEVRFDTTALRSWDVALASSLWQRLSALARPPVQIDLQGLPEGLREILSMALTETSVVTTPRLEPGRIARVGASTQAWWNEGRRSLTFVGEVLMSVGRLLRGRSGMRWSDLAWQVEQTGPRSLPIVALVSFLVGLIVAYMGAAQLQRFGAQNFIADLVTVGVVREVAALLVGIVLAGRVGAAFAAQIGSMRANEEVDALTTLGVNAVDFLVLPRVLALLIVGPMLTAFAAVVGMGVGWLVAVGLYGVTPLEYVYASAQALTLPHVLIGLLKGTVYSVLVALAGCLQGMSAGRSAQAVGDATTAAVVQAIVWMVVAASVLTVVFQQLGW